MIEWHPAELNAVFGITNDTVIHLTEEELEPVTGNFVGRPGMHSEEGKRDLAEAARQRISKTWNIYYDDGRVETIWNLDSWCYSQGYDPSNVRKVGRRTGSRNYRSYKGIIKIEDKNAPSDYNPWKWRVKYNCGKQVNVFSLDKWCKLNDANAGALVAMSKGKKKKYKNIIEVVRLS